MGRVAVMPATSHTLNQTFLLLHVSPMPLSPLREKFLHLIFLYDIYIPVFMLFTFKANKTLILCFPFGYFGAATSHKHHTSVAINNREIIVLLLTIIVRSKTTQFLLI